MVSIRNSVFETNSSSSHSLVFSKKNRGYSYDLPVDADGVLTIPFGEFGWGPDILKTPIEKLSYLITDNGGYCYDDDDKSWDDLVEEVLNNSRIQEILDIVKSHCPNIKEIVFEPASSYYPRGYIDHDSVGTSNETDFEDLVFNNDIIILIDNDNSCYFYDYKEYNNYGEEPKCDPEDLFDKSVEEIIETQRNSFY